MTYSPGNHDPDLPVLRAVNRALLSSKAPTEVGRAVLEAVGDSLGLLVGLIWVVDETGETLRPLAWWRARVHEAGAFEKVSRAYAFRPSEGLPGHVWREGQPYWNGEIHASGYFLRLEAAAAEGLHGALAFPLWADGQIVGVMEFFTDRLLAPVEALLGTFWAIGETVGTCLVVAARAPQTA